eukprot:2250856-Prymnesium_polylepis.1
MVSVSAFGGVLVRAGRATRRTQSALVYWFTGLAVPRWDPRSSDGHGLRARMTMRDYCRLGAVKQQAVARSQLAELKLEGSILQDRGPCGDALGEYLEEVAAVA